LQNLSVEYAAASVVTQDEWDRIVLQIANQMLQSMENAAASVVIQDKWCDPCDLQNPSVENAAASVVTQDRRIALCYE
jgi:hypothetical protein